MIQAPNGKSWLIFGLVASLLLGYAGGIATDNRVVRRFNRTLQLSVDRPFPDAVGLLAAADSVRRGADPYVANPFDPYRRRFNYPPLTLRLTVALGLGLADARWFGLGVAAAFVAAAGLLFREVRPRNAMIIGVFLLSQPAFLGIENGNIDLLIFALLAVALVRRSPLAGALGIFVAAALKLFPVFALSLSLTEPSNRRRIPWILATLAMVLYLAAIRHPLEVIRMNAPAVGWCSWGDHTILFHWGVPGAIWLSRSAAVLLALGGFALGRRLSPRDGWAIPSWEGRFAWAGSAIICGAYFLGTNHNYRLVFLLFLLPLLTRLTDADERDVRRAAWTGLALLFPLFWNWAIYCQGANRGLHLGALEEALPLGAVGVCGAVLAFLSPGVAGASGGKPGVGWT